MPWWPALSEVEILHSSRDLGRLGSQSKQLCPMGLGFRVLSSVKRERCVFVRRLHQAARSERRVSYDICHMSLHHMTFSISGSKSKIASSTLGGLEVLTGHNHYVMCAHFHPKEETAACYLQCNM